MNSFKNLLPLLLLYFLLSHPTYSYSIDLLKAPIKPGQTIAVYTGAFDPPHFGHDEVIRYALSQGIDYVIVVPDSKFNQHKPFITDIKLRNILLHFLYETELSILTSSLDYPAIVEYLAKLNKNNKLVAILGSDNVLRHIHQGTTPKLKADSWLVIPRDQDKNDLPLKELKWFAYRPVVIADMDQLKQQGYSSTNIRNTIRSHPEFYEGRFNPPLSQLPIDCGTKSFICDFKLYQNIPQNIAESNQVIDQITKTIIQQLPQLPQFEQSTDYTVVNAQQEGIGGLSGNLIFFVTDHNNKKIMTVKVFLTTAKDWHYNAELKTIDLFHQLHLKYSVPVQKIFSLPGNSFNLLGMEYVHGTSLESMLKELNHIKDFNGQRYEALKKIQKSCSFLGSALAELHGTHAQKVGN
ncbi:adenylyltransferase/cytidyltransferase family protein [Candidatus Dependentiae bacterium]|nr:adenylyltransferase/cytidyltransferase family protein [Candidatus Dependentiae bacterium]